MAARALRGAPTAAPAKNLSLSGSVGWVGAGFKQQGGGGSDGSATIEVLREPVQWWFLAYLWRYSVTKNWVRGCLLLLSLIHI